MCLEPLLRGQMVVYLSCGHVFHHACLESWVTGKDPRMALCPACRARIYDDDGNVIGEEQSGQQVVKVHVHDEHVQELPRAGQQQ